MDLDEFQARLGYRFLNESYLRDALIHPTYANEQKLATRNDDGQFAFLGDALLSLAVAQELLKTSNKKGALDRKRAEFVNNEHLADVGTRLKLQLTLGEGEKTNSEGERKRLSSGVEAVMGAVFLDAGADHAMRVARALLQLDERD